MTGHQTFMDIGITTLDVPLEIFTIIPIMGAEWAKLKKRRKRWLFET